MKTPIADAIWDLMLDGRPRTINDVFKRVDATEAEVKAALKAMASTGDLTSAKSRKDTSLTIYQLPDKGRGAMTCPRCHGAGWTLTPYLGPQPCPDCAKKKSEAK